MELERLEVDEPDKAWKLSGEPRAIALQSLGLKLYFAFGPNDSWILDCPTATTSYNIPETFWAHVFHAAVENKRMARPFWVALGPHDVWHVGCINCDESIYRIASPSLLHHYRPLYDWLKERPGRVGGIHIAFGPGDTFFACDVLGKRIKSSQTIPQNLRDVLALNPRKNPAKVALGINDSYFLLWSDGEYKWNLRQQYQQLEQILRDAKRDGKPVKFLALNPHAGNEFFLDFGNYCVKYSLPPSWVVQVTKALEDSMNPRDPGLREVEFHSFGDDNTVPVPGSYAAQLRAQQQNAVRGGGTTQIVIDPAKQIETVVKVAAGVGVLCCLAESGACCCAVM